MEAKITGIPEDMTILLYNFSLVFAAHIVQMGIYGFAQKCLIIYLAVFRSHTGH